MTDLQLLALGSTMIGLSLLLLWRIVLKLRRRLDEAESLAQRAFNLAQPPETESGRRDRFEDII